MLSLPISEIFLKHLVNSYEACFLESLCPSSPEEDLGEALFLAEFVLLSHGGEADPLFNFGNQKALDLWELSWDQLVGMPSRLSAEPDERAEREVLLSEVKEKGWSKGYRGIRVSSSGKRFVIEKARIWNIVDSEGLRIGQGACFSNWQYL
jgi:hypothetical protein